MCAANAFVCSKCGKECKDKKGLTKHENVCGGLHTYQCPGCEGVYSTKSNLTKHIDTCKVLREQQLKTLEAKKYVEYEEQISKLKEEKDSILEFSKYQLKECKEQYQTSLRQKQEDCDRQVKLRDYDVVSLSQQNKELKEQVAILTQKNKELDEQFKQAMIAERAANNNVAYLAKNNVQYAPSVIQNISNVQTQQNFFLQPFNPRDFQGRINPPDTMICSIQQLSDFLYDGGFGNYLRITDKSRNTGIWNKPGEGVIRDVKCQQITDAAIDTIISDLQKQKAWLDDEIKRTEETSPDNHDKIIKLIHQRKFTTGIIEKANGYITDLQKELGSRAKDKNNTTIDPIRYTSYKEIQSHVFTAFTRNVEKWLYLSPYDLGLYLGKELEGYFLVEGGSFSQHFILIDDDQGKRHLMYDRHWSKMIEEGFLEPIKQSKLWEWNSHLLSYLQSLTHKEVWLFNETERKLKMIEVLKGMIKTKRHLV